MSNTPSLRSLLEEWHRRASINKNAHYDAGRYFAKLNHSLGIPVIVLSAIVGTSVFATLEQQVDLRIRIVFGLTNVAIAVLGSLQTFFGYAERVEKHRLAGAKYGSIARELEQVIASGDATTKRELLDRLREHMDSLSQESPQIPPKIWRRAETWFAEATSRKPWIRSVDNKK
jgi:hypothetical protein